MKVTVGIHGIIFDCNMEKIYLNYMSTFVLDSLVMKKVNTFLKICKAILQMATHPTST